MTDLKVEIGGLTALNRALRGIDKEAPKQLRIVFNSAGDLLVDRARPTIPQLSGAARRSLVARSTRTSARVSIGGNRARYVPWLDFGGAGRIKGRPADRQFLREGRYIYPTLRRIRPEIDADLQAGLEAVVAGVGLEMH